MSMEFTWTMVGPGGFTLAAIGDGVFSPGSPLTSFTLGFQQQRLFNDGSRRKVVVDDIYINSDAPHDLNLYYRPFSVSFLPSGPGPLFNDTLIYSYVGRTDCNPFHENDDSPTLRRLKPLVFGQMPGNPPTGGEGTLQFQVPAFAGTVRVTVQYALVNPGGGLGA